MTPCTHWKCKINSLELDSEVDQLVISEINYIHSLCFVVIYFYCVLLQDKFGQIYLIVQCDYITLFAFTVFQNGHKAMLSTSCISLLLTGDLGFSQGILGRIF